MHLIYNRRILLLITKTEKIENMQNNNKTYTKTRNMSLEDSLNNLVFSFGTK